MVYSARVVRVMIASPGDVDVARGVVRDSLQAWNDANAAKRQIILHPVGWETAVPLLGERPQEIINQQVLDDADVVVALFGHRLGQPTGISPSGTAEEIERARAHGKLVHVFFSERSIPRDVDPDELARLNAFRDELKKRDLLGTFANPEELAVKLWPAIEHDLGVLDLAPPENTTQHQKIRFIAQEHEQLEPPSRGQGAATRRRWVALTNDSDLDARDVRIEAEGYLKIDCGRQGTTFPGRQTRKLPYLAGPNSSREKIVHVSWLDADGEGQTQDISLG